MEAWYETIKGSAIEQGDILLRFPIPMIAMLDTEQPTPISWRIADVVVLTQSCDLEENRKGLENVLLAPVQIISEAAKTNTNLHSIIKPIAKGQINSIHLLPPLPIEVDESGEGRLVIFSAMFSIPLTPFRGFVNVCGDRARLRPPFRENLSHSLANYLSRVALPSNYPIPTIPT